MLHGIISVPSPRLPKPHTCPKSLFNLGDCQNYGPFWGPYYNTGPNLGDPKRDHNFDDNPLFGLPEILSKAPGANFVRQKRGRASIRGVFGLVLAGPHQKAHRV